MAKKIENAEPVIETPKEEVYGIEEFCSLTRLNKYYLDSLKPVFQNVKKTIPEWKKFLTENSIVSEKLFEN